MTSQDKLILTPISPGELIDKITVLRIKEERIKDPIRLLNIKKELLMLEEIRNNQLSNYSERLDKLKELEASLQKFNEEIWDMGHKIREFGEQKNFGKEFINVAYGIHLANDRRATLKKEINFLFGSSIIEEKSYKDWK